MKPETIKAIFTNLLFVIGVALIITGFVRGTLTVTRLLTFEKYPLDSWEEQRCENAYIPSPVETKAVIPPTKEELEETKAKCLGSLEYQRRVKKTEDIVQSVSFLVSGAALVYFFRRFIA